MERKTVILSTVVLITSACVCVSPRTLLGKQTSSDSPGMIGRCPLPPESFQESDLVGTWVARYAYGTDTLILKEDGTYQQIYDNPQTGDYYESDWQEWWVEYRESGIPNLHLKGMKPDGISKDSDSLWHDFCEDRAVEVHGEVMLLVIGASASRAESSPRGIELWHLKPNADTFSRPFFLQE